MWNMLWPVLLVVAANTVYNICAKSTPEDVNSFASLIITYGIAALCSLVMFFLTSGQKNLAAELGKTNWTAWVLGAVLVALEFGIIAIYRAGWKVGIGIQVTNIGLAITLVLVGVLLYKEAFTLRQLVGLIVCTVGLVMVAK